MKTLDEINADIESMEITESDKALLRQEVMRQVLDNYPGVASVSTLSYVSERLQDAPEQTTFDSEGKYIDPARKAHVGDPRANEGG